MRSITKAEEKVISGGYLNDGGGFSITFFSHSLLKTGGSPSARDEARQTGMEEGMNATGNSGADILQRMVDQGKNVSFKDSLLNQALEAIKSGVSSAIDTVQKAGSEAITNLENNLNKINAPTKQ